MLVAVMEPRCKDITTWGLTAVGVKLGDKVYADLTDDGDVFDEGIRQVVAHVRRSTDAREAQAEVPAGAAVEDAAISCARLEALAGAGAVELATVRVCDAISAAGHHAAMALAPLASKARPLPPDLEQA